MERPSSTISRRKVLLLAIQGIAALMMGGCKNIFDQLHQNKKVLSVVESAEGLNRRVLRLLTPKNALAKEFSEKEISSYF